MSLPVGWHGPFGGFVGTAGMMASVAVAEERLFRGVLFRIVEEHTGTVIALVVSALLFGATHLVNVNATQSGPAPLTGGTFGPEASLLALLVCLGPTAFWLRRAARTGQIRHRPRRAVAQAGSDSSSKTK
ncbi:CPBP family intramembrane glutamic endopeptidase [Nonomuraea angiospora]|uniref:CPBP family intramembrane glutamic endopeptidase n=1 Tax=Nonomuraea angiospora TaxID=46172 RepID=UPI00332115EA